MGVDDLQENRFVVPTKAEDVKDKGVSVLESLNKQRDARSKEAGFAIRKVEIEGELQELIEGDLEVAKSVLADIGYSKEETSTNLPKLGEINFYTNLVGGDIVSGGVMHVGGKMEITVGSYFSPTYWAKVGPVFLHEVGHFPALRVYAMGKIAPRLVSFGFDRRKQVVNILGKNYPQSDRDGTYMSGVLREPLANLFGYYCTNKKGVDSFPASDYYRETAFLITLLEKLASVRQTSFFEEFARIYKAFNSRDFEYFQTLKTDFAKIFANEDGLEENQAATKATEFIKKLNGIVAAAGRDCVITSIANREGENVVQEFESGGQLTDIAKFGGFEERYKENISKMMGYMETVDTPGTELILPGAKTKMVVHQMI